MTNVMNYDKYPFAFHFLNIQFKALFQSDKQFLEIAWQIVWIGTVGIEKYLV